MNVHFLLQTCNRTMARARYSRDGVDGESTVGENAFLEISQSHLSNRYATSGEGHVV